MLKIIKVTGESLSPFFLPGDYVLISTSSRVYHRIEKDDIIVFHHPDFGRLIKSVFENNQKENNLIVRGIHPNSISSHKMGQVPYKNLEGKVIFHFRNPAHRKQRRT
jgi:phage repressor protein C with HTH and peptisase S24 domain